MIKSKKITVLDYKCGNIFTIINALSKQGYEVDVTEDFKSIVNSNKIILPGVGAFSAGIGGLKTKYLDEALKIFVKKGNPILGICLGMRLLFSKSSEFGQHKGLNFIKGNVKKLLREKNKKIPHTGWNSIQINTFSLNKNNQARKFLNGIKDNSYFYFVHSFAARVSDKKDNLSYTMYGGEKFSSIVSKENVFGTQFHPEKSGKVGYNLLKNFLNL